MSIPQYEQVAVKATSNLDLSKLAGKSVIVTGGAMGLGKAYTKAFAAAGAYVTIGDLSEKLGSEVAATISAKGQGVAQFLKCDVRIWEDQVALFKAATSSPLYNVSKFGVRALMRNLRWTSRHESIRVNVVAPWVINTPILPEGLAGYLESQGTEFALEEDVAKAMLKIASDRNVNGRSFAIVPRSWEVDGYVDLDHDDFKQGDPLGRWQKKLLSDWYRDAHLSGIDPPASSFSTKI